MRQSKEESQTLWKLELESAKTLTLTPEHQALIDLVTTKIDDYTLTYDEYLTDIMDCLKQASDDADPKEVIKNMCNTLIEKYNGEEVRSEQDLNGFSTLECDGVVGGDTDNGGREVWGEPMAEPSGVLEEVQSSTVETSDSNR